MPSPGTAPCQFCGRPQPEMAAYIRTLEQKLRDCEESNFELTRRADAAEDERERLITQRDTAANLAEPRAEEVEDLTAQLAEAQRKIDSWANARESALEILHQTEARLAAERAEEALGPCGCRGEE